MSRSRCASYRVFSAGRRASDRSAFWSRSGALFPRHDSSQLKQVANDPILVVAPHSNHVSNELRRRRVFADRHAEQQKKRGEFQ